MDFAIEMAELKPMGAKRVHRILQVMVVLKLKEMKMVACLEWNLGLQMLKAH